MTYLQARDLAFSYPGRPVLKNVSVQVSRGELVSLVGSNGSGKSTLIRLLTGILKATAGEVTIDGIPLPQMKASEIARSIGVVIQDPPADFDFSCHEVVMMGRAPHLGPFAPERQRDRDVVANALAMTDAAHLSERSILQVSGGERQRVLVARALAQEPSALLLDEPTAHLDINHQAELLHLVRRLTKEQNMATLAVLHDLNLASAFSDRILVLQEGRLMADGSPDEVLNPEQIEASFGAHTLVMAHPESGLPVVVLRAETQPAVESENGSCSAE